MAASTPVGCSGRRYRQDFSTYCSALVAIRCSKRRAIAGSASVNPFVRSASQSHGTPVTSKLHLVISITSFCISRWCSPVVDDCCPRIVQFGKIAIPPLSAHANLQPDMTFVVHHGMSTLATVRPSSIAAITTPYSILPLCPPASGRVDSIKTQCGSILPRHSRITQPQFKRGFQL